MDEDDNLDTSRNDVLCCPLIALNITKGLSLGTVTLSYQKQPIFKGSISEATADYAAGLKSIL